MSQVCELVQRDAFTQSLQSLGLLDTNPVGNSPAENQKMTKSASFSAPKSQHGYKVCFQPVLPQKMIAVFSVKFSRIALRFTFSQRKYPLETLPPATQN